MKAIELADALGRFRTSTVYEAAGKMGDMSPRIRPIAPGLKLAGIAVTVRIWPGDTLAVLRAIDGARPGSVIVLDADGERSAVWGGTSSLACEARGVRGCVTNGCVRDVEELSALNFPVFAAGVSVRGTFKNHSGWCDIPVSVGDCVVYPGDIVLGDGDGVVVVPAKSASEILSKAKDHDRLERERDMRAKNGESLCAILGLDKS